MTVDELRQIAVELRHLEALIATITEMPVQSPAWQTALQLFTARRAALLELFHLTPAQWAFTDDRVSPSVVVH